MATGSKNRRRPDHEIPGRASILPALRKLSGIIVQSRARSPDKDGVAPGKKATTPVETANQKDPTQARLLKQLAPKNLLFPMMSAEQAQAFAWSVKASAVPEVLLANAFMAGFATVAMGPIQGTGKNYILSVNPNGPTHQRRGLAASHWLTPAAPSGGLLARKQKRCRHGLSDWLMDFGGSFNFLGCAAR